MYKSFDNKSGNLLTEVWIQISLPRWRGSAGNLSRFGRCSSTNSFNVAGSAGRVSKVDRVTVKRVREDERTGNSRMSQVSMWIDSIQFGSDAEAAEVITQFEMNTLLAYENLYKSGNSPLHPSIYKKSQ